jgi:ankyrin repeat domain-containing protein 50
LSLSILEGVSDVVQKLNDQNLDDNREAILRWFFITDPSTNHNAACKKCQPGSGRWVFERPEFKQWQATGNSLLWLHGMREYLKIQLKIV